MSEKKNRMGYFKRLIKDRTIIIAAVVALLFALILLFTVDIKCTSHDFGCYYLGCEDEVDEEFNGSTCSMFCSKHWGIKAESENMNCEWYPLLCGIDVTSNECGDPIIFGVGICSGSTIDSKPNIPFMEESTDIPIDKYEFTTYEGEGFETLKIEFILEDRYKDRVVCNTLEELFDTDLYKKIGKESLFHAQSVFKIYVRVTLDAKYDMSLESTLTLYKRINGTSSKEDDTTSTRNEIKAGINYIEIASKDLPYGVYGNQLTYKFLDYEVLLLGDVVIYGKKGE